MEPHTLVSCSGIIHDDLVMLLYYRNQGVKQFDGNLILSLLKENVLHLSVFPLFHEMWVSDKVRISAHILISPLDVLTDA